MIDSMVNFFKVSFWASLIAKKVVHVPYLYGLCILQVKVNSWKVHKIIMIIFMFKILQHWSAKKHHQLAYFQLILQSTNTSVDTQKSVYIKTNLAKGEATTWQVNLSQNFCFVLFFFFKGLKYENSPFLIENVKLKAYSKISNRGRSQKF